MKKILDHKVGEYLYEGSGEDPFTAGKIVAMSESTTKKDTVYVLLQSDAGEYTIYSTVASCHCAPRVARFIPQEDFMDLISRMSSSGSVTEITAAKPEKKRRLTQEAGGESPALPPQGQLPAPTPQPSAPTEPSPAPVVAELPPPEPDTKTADTESAGESRDNIFDAIVLGQA